MTTRRSFITLLGGAAVTWPLGARAQQAAMPVIGFLHNGVTRDDRTAAFLEGLRAAGFVEGKNVVIEYRWGGDSRAQWPALADDLVRRQVNVIVAMGSPAAVAAKSATATIPILFLSGGDPVKIGLVASLNRPGGNATGVSRLGHELAPKQLELLHELVPKASVIAVIVNPNNPNTESDLTDLLNAARSTGRRVHILKAGSEREIDVAIDTLVKQQDGALLVGNDGFYRDQRVRLVEAAARHALPAVYSMREFVEAGGLVSYGSNSIDSIRQVGTYTARILKGEKPADLPVQQATKFDLVINLTTAKTLGLTVPPSLLARADEVIE